MGQRFGLIHIGGAIRAQFTVSLRGCIHYPSAANADESREGRHTVYISDEESIVSSPDNLHILDIRISTPAMLSSGLRACRWQHQQGKLSAYIPNPRTEVIEVLHSHLRLTAHLAAKIFERALLAVRASFAHQRVQRAAHALLEHTLSASTPVVQTREAGGIRRRLPLAWARAPAP
jgi:hypothetical protein